MTLLSERCSTVTLNWGTSRYQKWTDGLYNVKMKGIDYLINCSILLVSVFKGLFQL